MSSVATGITALDESLMLMLSAIASVLLHHERADPELAIVVLLNGLWGRQYVPVQERARRGSEHAERHRLRPVQERRAELDDARVRHLPDVPGVGHGRAECDSLPRVTVAHQFRTRGVVISGRHGEQA